MSSSQLECQPAELLLQFLEEGAMTIFIPSTVTSNQVFTHSAIASSSKFLYRTIRDNNVAGSPIAVLTSAEEFYRPSEEGPDLQKLSDPPINKAATVVLAGPYLRGWERWPCSWIMLEAMETERKDILPDLQTFVLDQRINSNGRSCYAYDLEQSLSHIVSSVRCHVRVHGGQRELYVHVGQSNLSTWSISLGDDCNPEYRNDFAAIGQITWQGSLSGLPRLRRRAEISFPDRTFILDATEYFQDDAHDVSGASSGAMSVAFRDRLSEVCEILKSNTKGSSARTELYLTVDTDNDTALQRLKACGDEVKALCAGHETEDWALPVHVGTGLEGCHIPYMLGKKTSA